jgi:hypothetical protein
VAVAARRRWHVKEEEEERKGNGEVTAIEDMMSFGSSG